MLINVDPSIIHCTQDFLYPQKSSTVSIVMRFLRLASQLLDCGRLLLGLSNHSVHRPFRGCLALKLMGSSNTVTRAEFVLEEAVLDELVVSTAAAAIVATI